MQSARTLALLGASCFALVLSSSAFAQSSIGAPSTPAEKTQTQQLNQTITNANAAADAQNDRNNAQYQAQTQSYQQQLAVYKEHRQNYEERSAGYEAARDRYVAGHARFHRGAWPARYEHSIIVDTTDLLGARVKTSNGRTVGHVEEIAMPAGRVDALRVTLDGGRGDIWVESADLRFDAGRKVVMTNLDRHDLYEMTRETY